MTGKGVTTHLPPKAAEVLLCLASSPGELVTREALLEQVWGAGHGSSEALSHSVGEIRHALDDHVDNPHYIQTLPRRGYRLVLEPAPGEQHTESIVIGAQNNGQDLGLFENLNRRGVFETALAYLVLGWLLIQVADIVFDQLLFPDWAGTFVTALVIAGFPIALLLSWFLEFRDGKAVVDDMTPRDVRRRRFSRTYISVLSGLALAAILVFIFDREFGLPRQVIEPATPDEMLAPVTENSIAVLPFLNVDGSDETQAFANGLVDDVINRLARVPGLRVSSRGDSFTLDPNSASGLVRNRLRVARYIEGSVEIAGELIRVTVQLIDSSDGIHLHSRTFTHDREDFFRIRDEITELTVSSLRVTLPDDIQARSRVATQIPEFDAYVLYRRGVDELDKPGTVDSLAAAIGWFDAALDVDTEYAAALAGKCRAHIVMFRETDDLGDIDAAERACAQALNSNPNLDIVHTALGQLHDRKGLYEQAEADFREALRINPQNVTAMMDLADTYRSLQRPDEAIELLRDAIGLQPGNWRAYAALGNFLYRRGEYEAAAEQYEVVIDIDNRNIMGLLGLGASYMLAGDFNRAAPVFARATDISPDAVNYSNLGLMHYYLGNHDEAVAAIQTSVEMQPDDQLLWANLGDVLTNAGRTEEAQAAYERAHELAQRELSLNDNYAPLLMDIAWIEAMLGNEQAAREYIAGALAGTPDDPYAHYIEALILVRFGDRDAALDSLERAVAQGYSTTILKAEPLLASLRDDPRFVALTGERPKGRQR